MLQAVKVTFAISFVNFSVMTLLTVFTCTSFIKNRIDLTSFGQIIATIAKVLFFFVVFSIFKPKIYFVVLGGLFYTIVLYSFHVFVTKKLLPTTKIEFRLARVGTIKQLISAGSWNSVYGVIELLMNGLDLTIANWFLDGRAMGLLSITVTIANASNSILSAVVNTFNPVLYKSYAVGDMEALRKQVERAGRMECVLMSVPLLGIVMFGQRFYALWLPEKDIADVMLLTGITAMKILGQIAGLVTNAMRTNFSTFNQLKPSALGRLLISMLNIPLVLILLKISPWYELDVLIIAGVSSMLWVLYYWCIEPWLISAVTKVNVFQYYRTIVRCLLMLLSVGVVFFVLNRVLPDTDSWMSFIIVVAGVGALGYLVAFLVGCTKSDKKEAFNIACTFLKCKKYKDN